MNEKDLTYYRSLLSGYYEGSLTAKQETQLMQMAADADLDTLPADLKADTLMLRDMRKLSEEINSFVDGLQLPEAPKAQPEKAHKGRRVWAWTLTSIVAAACIALAIVFVGKEQNKRASTLSSSDVVTASANPTESAVDEETPYEEQLPSIAPEESVGNRLAQIAPVREEVPEIKVVSPKKEAAPANEKEGVEKDVTDVDEATAIIEKSLTLFASNVEKSDNSVQKTNEILNDTFEETEKTLNKILL